MKTNTLPALRIYVACLAAYNSGTLHGAWIDADQDADAIFEEVQTMLADSPVPDAEEWAIHDFQGFGNVTLSESESLERVSELAKFIEKHGETGIAVLEHFAGDLDEAQQGIENYIGTYASLADYAEEVMEGETIPERIAPYIDYERMAKDWEMNGDIFTIEPSYDKVMVFANR